MASGGLVGEGAQQYNEIVRDSPSGGKGLFAYKDFPAGERVLRLQRPLITALDNRRLNDTCANCYEWAADVFMRELLDEFEPPNVQLCTGCGTLKYCSKRCQTESWKREHKHVCKLLKKLIHKGVLPNAPRAVLRMLHLAANGSSRDALMEMTSHMNDITVRGGQSAEYLMVFSKGIHEYSGTSFGMEYVQNFLAIVLTNSLTIWTAAMDPLGIAVDPLAAKANHSCDPNAFIVWDGVELHFRSLKPIKKGEEVFISYIDPTQPYSRRQHELDEKWYFKCKCSKCQLQWSGPNDRFLKEVHRNEEYGGHLVRQGSREDIAKPVIQEMMNIEKSLNNSNADYLGIEVGHDITLHSMLHGAKSLMFAQKLAYASFKAATSAGELEHMAVLDSGLKACVNTGMWPDERQPLPLIRHTALSNYMAFARRFPEGLVKAFFQALKLYFDCFPRMYPQTFHPLRVINKWTIANLALNLAADAEDNASFKPLTDQGLDFGVVIWGFLKETLDNVQYSHGKDHRFAAAVKRKVDEVKTDMTRDDLARLRWAEGQFERVWKVLRKLATSPATNNFKQFQKENERDIQGMIARGEVTTN